jgi:soluble lytic murein transglycosylase
LKLSGAINLAILTGIIFAGQLAAHADPKTVQEAVSKATSGDFAKAVKILQSKDDAKFSATDLAQKYFALGVWSIELKNFDDGRAYLQKSLDLKSPNKVYANFLIGHSFKEQGKHKEAAQYLNTTLQLNPPKNIAFQARLDFAEMSRSLGNLPAATQHLEQLERRARGDYRHPEIVWRLIGVEMQRDRRVQACRWARKMYSRYPGHPLASDWGVDLFQNKYEGEATGCLTSAKELKQRIRQLQLAAQDEKARAEIELLAARAKPHQEFEIDIMRAEFLEWQGFVDEALTILVKYYDKQRSNFNFLMFMGKVAARAGEYQTAVGAYVRAHELSPRSKAGRKALFSAAFLSYQFQDYDGANRKFQDFAARYGSSGLSRDAKWHMAWIKYLKGNYSGAKSSFKQLVVEYKGRGRRRRVVRDDRARYWLAMTELKQENLGEAREQFTELSRKGRESYYGMLAQYRLSQLPAPKMRQLAGEDSKVDLESGPIELTSVPVPAPNTTATSPEQAGEAVVPTPEEQESEETLQTAVTVEDTEESEESADAESDAAAAEGDGATEVAVGDETEATAVDENVAQSSFKDPKLQERFDRANSLIRLGLNDWARWELYEIERRTSNKTYLRNLMDAYRRIGSFNRMSYISEIYFGSERAAEFDKNTRPFLEASYPRAYSESVEGAASKFNTDPALVYGIMRAESHFNKDAISPVGARGLMQVMPYTAEKLATLLNDSDYQDSKLIEPATNVRLGVRYLSRLSRKFSDQVPLVAAGYNAGPHRVYNWLSSFGHLSMDEFIEHVPFVETRNYIKKVIKNYAVYKRLYSGQNVSLDFLTAQVPVKVSGRQSPRENWEVLD